MRHPMWPVGRLASLAVLVVLLGGLAPARADTIHPSDAKGIRGLPGQEPLLLGFLAVSRFPEDRTVLAFDVRGFSETVAPTILNIDLQNIDAGGPVGVIDLFALAGGVPVTPDLFDAPATFVTSIPSNQSGLFQVDVTPAIQAAVDAGESFIAFRLSTITDDRYFLGPIAGRPLPTLSTVPEPSGLALMSAGLLAVLGCHRQLQRQRARPVQRAPAGSSG